MPPRDVVASAPRAATQLDVSALSATPIEVVTRRRMKAAPGRGQSPMEALTVTSEHHPANPVSDEDLLQDENAKLREQIDAARDAIAPIRSGLNQLKAALYRGTDYKARCRLAGDWLSELLEAGGEQFGNPLTGRVDTLGEELEALLILLTGLSGDHS